MIRSGLAVLALAVLAACASADTAQAPAPAPQSETATTTADPYLWLEEVEGERALAWVRQQNDRSLPILQNDPRYARLEAAALEVSQSRERLPLGAIQGGYLYNFWQDQEHVRGIWRRSRLDAYARNAPRWETLIDMDALAASENANWVWHGADCDPSGTRCMIALSNGGLDAATQREFDLTTKRFVDGGFVVPEAKANVTWFDRDTLMIATDWGEGSLTESGYPFILKGWRRGTPLSSATEIARGRPTDVLIAPANLEDVDGTHVAIVYQGETFFETVLSIYDGTSVRRLTLPRKATIQGLFHRRLIVTLEQEWTIGGRTIPNGTLVALPVASATSATPAVEILFTPSPRQSIENVALTADAVLVSGFDNVRGTLQRFELRNDAWQGSRIDLPPSGVISIAGASTRDHRAFVVFEDFLTPPTLYSLENRATRVRAVRSLPAQFDASPYVVEQFQVASRDGTQVPYFVVHRRDMQLNGQNPTLLYAYGGFQLSQTPSYSPYIGRLWLDQGGVYVLANIRGGGEFGPAWHDAGLKLRRQVIYDDFYAVERDLVTRNITSPRRLGISGRSNGGLLMGVMLNQHPEMVHAAVIGSPLLDMLRYDQLLAGASWVDEYGSPQVPEERAWLEQLTPYQNLRPGPDFPLVFIYTSTKDDRVHPGHARKYAARLAELGVPFLYYENTDGGHQATANLREAARRRALEYTYLSQRLMD